MATYRLRADVRGTSITEYSRSIFDKQIDAWNHVEKFRTMIAELYGYPIKLKDVIVYVCKGNGANELLMTYDRI